MIPDCVDPLTNPIVQDMLRRRDETIECLLEEIKETEKLKDDRKQKYNWYIKDENTHFKKWFLLWVVSCTILVCLIMLAWRLIWTAWMI